MKTKTSPLARLLSLFIVFTFSSPALFAQGKAPTGVIAGYVKNARTQEPIVGVVVRIDSAAYGALTDEKGYYKIQNVPTRSYNVTAKTLGFQPKTQYDVIVSSGNTNFINFELEPAPKELAGVKVKRQPFTKLNVENTNSIQTLSTQEIKSYPGGNNDVAKVVQSLPGVSGSVGFRNDIIIRGGAPNENVYYLDGVEIPNINHFATQGSAGGPVGMLNVTFIEDVTLSTSAFASRYDNVLSGVLQFKQRTGNPDRTQGNVRVGASEFGITLEGPTFKNYKDNTYIISVRRSYLQTIFKYIVKLPFLPSYWDYQYKVTQKLGKKDEISLIGLGSIDQFTFNPPTREDGESDEAWWNRLSIYENIPKYEQWSSTIGLQWKHLLKNGYMNVVASGNYLNNKASKYTNNREDIDSLLRLKYASIENENKLRLEVNKFKGKWKFSYGGVFQHSRYENNTFNKLPAFTIQYETALQFFRLGAFVNVSRSFWANRLTLTGGLRSDVNTFQEEGLNPLNTLSPRAGLSYALTEKINLNASWGIYHKLPAYTSLGFKDASGTYVNKNSRYIRSDHYVAGFEYLPRPSTRITLEGFYKGYDNYPVSVRDSISLANLGGDFGIIGNEAIASVGRGRAYGVEFCVQQKLSKNFYGVFAYTFYFSEFSGFDRSKLIPSAWDQRHLISFTGGYKLPRNWEIGVRFRLLGRAPYTPFDTLASVASYPLTGGGVLDYSRVNTERLGIYNALDIRIDKKWNFKKLTLDLYFEAQNAYGSAQPSPASFTLARNADNTFKTPFEPVFINSATGAVIPSIGLIVEF